MLSPSQVADFQKLIHKQGKRYARDLPWRSSPDPYHVLVSEIMLQQTQVDRVVPKYRAFLETFPDFTSLAGASFAEVLQAWHGLGYNRRARYLHQAAKKVFNEFGGKLPRGTATLQKLPGIGPNTAGSIQAFAFNLPAVFVETNIRSVYLHHFFRDRVNVADTEILELIRVTLDTKQPRRWYEAVMDYGSALKKQETNPSRRSLHHTKQSQFEGSMRQLRGRVLAYLLSQKQLKPTDRALFGDERLEAVLQALEREGMIRKQGSSYVLV